MCCKRVPAEDKEPRTSTASMSRMAAAPVRQLLKQVAGSPRLVWLGRSCIFCHLTFPFLKRRSMMLAYGICRCREVAAMGRTGSVKGMSLLCQKFPTWHCTMPEGAEPKKLRNRDGFHFNTRWQLQSWLEHPLCLCCDARAS